MNKTIFIIIILHLFSLNGSFGANKIDESKKKEIYGTLYSFPSIYDGSPYLFDSWSFTSINLINGDIIDSVRVKYNMLTSEIVFYHEKYSKLFYIDQATLNSFTMNSINHNQFHFVKYNGIDVGYKLYNNDFVRILYDGKIKFLLKYSATIIKANEINTKDKISPKKMYFIQKGDEAIEIKLRIKSIYKIFPDYKQEIKRLVVENKIKKKSEKDITKLIKLIDENLNILK